MNIVARRVSIWERPRDYRWWKQQRPWEMEDLHYGWRRTYKTASHALKAVKRQDREALRDRGQQTVTEITWHPSTMAGRAAIQAIGGVEIDGHKLEQYSGSDE